MKTKTKKLLTMLLSLCMLLSLMPMTAFAAVVELPQGVTTSTETKIKYRTKVKVTANVYVKDSDGTVLESTQTSKSSEDYLSGGVGTLHGKCYELQREIERPYQANGRIARENEDWQMSPDHSEAETFYVFTPASGAPVDFGTDTEAVKQYFAEHPDAAGTFTKLTYVYTYRIYEYTYDLNVQKNSQPASTISAAMIENAKFTYQPGDAPQATACVSEADTDKYEIAYECWKQLENNDPVAAWYSDDNSHDSLPTITNFESGKSYVYSVMLKPKAGYSFSSGTAMTVNGQSVTAVLNSDCLYVSAVETITPKANTEGDFNIKTVSLNGLSNNLTPNDDFTFATIDENSNYTIESQYWHSDGQPENRITPESADKKPDVKQYYTFTITLAAKGDYVFPEYNPKNHSYRGSVYVNGEQVFDVMMGTINTVSSDGKKLSITLYPNTEVIVGTIDSVAVVDAILSYQVGDAPKAAASVAAGDGTEPHYKIQYENWDKRVNGVSVARWYSDENKYYDGCVRIENFEEGQQYEYFIELKADQGWIFESDSMYILSNATLNGNRVFALVGVGNKTVILSALREMTPTQTITDVSVVNVNTNLDAASPISFTARADASCAGKFDIAEEMWEAAQPLNDMIKNTDTPRAPIAGGEYWYSLELTAKDGYVFSQDFSDENNIIKDSVTFTVNGVSYQGQISVSSDGKTLTAWEFMDPVTVPKNTGASAITSAAVENVKLDYKDGEVPQASARRAGVNMDKYDILYESWEKREKTDEFTTETVAYWYSDKSWYQEGDERLTAFNKDGKYQYYVRLKAKDGYTFSGITADDITINGKSLPESSDVIVLDEGKSCIAIYGMTLCTVRPLESVVLCGISTSFYVDGDKPRFNGYSGSAFSDVAYEMWEDKDDRSVGISSDKDINEKYSQPITSFKYGKTYTYGAVFNIADLGLERGFRFDENTKLYINGQFVDLSNKRVDVADDGLTIWFYDVLTMTPGSSAPHSHSCSTAWKYDSTNHWHECTCGDKADTAAHTFKWITDKEATADEKGSKHEECTVCGYKKAAIEESENKTQPNHIPKTGDMIWTKTAVYRITKTGTAANNTVTLERPIKKTYRTFNVPSTIKSTDGKYTFKVTGISKNAFKKKTKLKKVVIGKNVKKIGANAFAGCKNLKTIRIASTSLTKKSIGKNAFKDIHKKAVIKVPKKKLKAYQKFLKGKGQAKSVKITE